MKNKTTATPCRLHRATPIPRPVRTGPPLATKGALATPVAAPKDLAS